MGGPLHGAVRPGACKKTIREQRDQIRALFQHGKDPQIGDKPLGRFRDARGGRRGRLRRGRAARHRLQPRLCSPGLQAGLYGASHRFSVIREDGGRPAGAVRAQPGRDPGAHDQRGPRCRVRPGHVPRLRGRDRRRAVDDRRVSDGRDPQQPGRGPREMFDRAVDLNPHQPASPSSRTHPPRTTPSPLRLTSPTSAARPARADSPRRPFDGTRRKETAPHGFSDHRRARSRS